MSTGVESDWFNHTRMTVEPAAGETRLAYFCFLSFIFVYYPLNLPIFPYPFVDPLFSHGIGHW
jgi:hypothetical protein